MRSEFFVQAVIATLLGLSAASTINPAAKTEDQAPNRDDSNLEISISQSIHRPHENSSSTSTVASILATRASPPPYRGNNERDTSGHGVVSREVDQAQDENLHADDAHMNSARTGHVHRPHVSRRHGHARREFSREDLLHNIQNPQSPQTQAQGKDGKDNNNSQSDTTEGGSSPKTLLIIVGVAVALVMIVTALIIWCGCCAKKKLKRSREEGRYCFGCCGGGSYPQEY